MSSRRHIQLVLLLIVAGYTQALIAKTREAILINSTSGLSNNDINDVFQDSKGYLWFATDDGLNRYDGYDYVVYRPVLSDSTSIASESVYALAEDSKGNIWVGTDKGLSRCDTKSNCFENILFYPQVPGEKRNHISDIVFSDDTTIWCFVSSKVIRYNTTLHTYVEYMLPFKEEASSRYRRNRLYYDYFHKMLLIGSEKGLYYLDTELGDVGLSFQKQVVINDIFYDNSGILWLGTSLGLARCNWDVEERLPQGCSMVFEDAPVLGICQNEQNKLIFATEENILSFDLINKELISDTFFTLNNAENIPPIRSLFLDRSQNLWIGIRGGLCQASMKEPQFSYYSSTTEGISLHNNMISSVYASESQLYLGSWNGGLEVIDLKKKTNAFFSKSNSKSYFPEEGVNAIYEDSKGNLWILSEGMYLFQKQNEKFIPAHEIFQIPGIEQIRGSRIFDMHELDNDILLISHQTGIYWIDLKHEIFRNISELTIDTGIIQLSQVRCIEPSENALWLGTVSGLIKYSLNAEAHKYYPIYAANGLIEDILTLKIDSFGQLWAGTPSGLFRFIKKEETFQSYSVEDGLANDYVYAIEEDKQGLLWLGTNKGISSLNPGTAEIRNFGVQHGLSCMEFNLNASYFSDNGLMMFGCINGVNFFNPDSLLKKRAIPQIEITGIKLFDEEVRLSLPFVPTEFKIRDNETIQLFFSLLDFSDPRYKVYQYRVSKPGKPGSWNNIGTENSIILSGLGHGKYKIEFLGSASDELWSLMPAILNLKVVAPVYRRRSFIVIMFLPFLFLIYFVFEFRTKTLKKSNRVLREKEIVAREVLRQKNLLSRRNKGIEDSLKYAQRIQYAMFTSEVEIKKMFPESFILQKPKDIVSGDFYWAKKIGSKVFIAAADCTGHGVPGAFMSLIGLEFFRQIISGQGVYKPSNILDEINKNFDLIFDNEDDLEMRDGMDLAFCVIDTNTNILEYSGAFNPLYVLRDGEIVEIKADKIMLGPDLGYGRKPFKNNIVELQKDDIIYLFSDGYADQFGGPEGKKFKFRRFRHLLLSIYDQPLSVQHKILENSFTDWQGDNEQVDDILVMGFRPVLSI